MAHIQRKKAGNRDCLDKEQDIGVRRQSKAVLQLCSRIRGNHTLKSKVGYDDIVLLNRE